MEKEWKAVAETAESRARPAGCQDHMSVHEALAAASEVIDRLEVIAQKLGEKIDPVMSGNVPADAANMERPSGNCKVAEEILQRAERVGEITWRLSSYCNRVSI